MKLTSLLATTAFATLIATGAFSQSAFDGSIGFDYISAPDDSFEYQTQINGSLVYSASPNIKLQLDLGSTTYETDDYSYYEYGIHAIYALNSSTDIGAFYGVEENYADSHFGVEVAYRSNSGIDVEAHVAQTDNGGDIGYIAGAKVGYTFDSIGSMPGGIEAYAGINNEYYDDWTINVPSMYVGVTADVWDDLQLNVRAASMDDGDYTYYTLGLTYNFGNGAVFTPRDFSSSFPGY